MIVDDARLGIPWISQSHAHTDSWQANSRPQAHFDHYAIRATHTETHGSLSLSRGILPHCANRAISRH